MAYVNVHVSKSLKEELAWATDKRLQVVSNIMLVNSGSMIKYDHSDSVIAYYTRWYAVHSVPTSYLRCPYIT